MKRSIISLPLYTSVAAKPFLMISVAEVKWWSPILFSCFCWRACKTILRIVFHYFINICFLTCKIIFNEYTTQSTNKVVAVLVLVSPCNIETYTNCNMIILKWGMWSRIIVFCLPFWQNVQGPLVSSGPSSPHLLTFWFLNFPPASCITSFTIMFGIFFTLSH